MGFFDNCLVGTFPFDADSYNEAQIMDSLAKGNFFDGVAGVTKVISQAFFIQCRDENTLEGIKQEGIRIEDTEMDLIPVKSSVITLTLLRVPTAIPDDLIKRELYIPESKFLKYETEYTIRQWKGKTLKIDNGVRKVVMEVNDPDRISDIKPAIFIRSFTIPVKHDQQETKCVKCKASGHVAKYCSQAQCTACGMDGHMWAGCPAYKQIQKDGKSKYSRPTEKEVISWAKVAQGLSKPPEIPIPPKVDPQNTILTPLGTVRNTHNLTRKKNRIQRNTRNKFPRYAPGRQ